MKRFVLNSTVAAIALLSASSAFANDYNSGVVTKTPSEGYTEVEYGSGWYLRGDITYNIDGRSEAGINAVAGVSAGIQTDYDDAVGARVGFGYRATPNTRIEINAEAIFSTDINGLGGRTFAAADFADPLNPVATTTPGSSLIDAEYTVSDLIVTGYYDLPRFGAFTPYVGAGAGIARISYNETETLTCTPSSATVACTSFPAGTVGVETTATRTLSDEAWTYAYQLTAGTAIAVDDRTSIDLSYSYTQIGSGDEIDYADGTAIDEDGVQLHQIRAGIRYDIW